MLVWFFLRRFYALFSGLFVFVTIILACSNFFVRLPFIPTLETIPIVFWTMLPLMALFAIPIAACLAIQIPLVMQPRPVYNPGRQRAASAGGSPLQHPRARALPPPLLHLSGRHGRHLRVWSHEL